MPPAATKSKSVKIFKFHIFHDFDPRQTQGSVRNPLDKLAVHIWLLIDHPNSKYCTL